MLELILFSRWLTMKCLAVAKMGQQCILNDSDLRQMNGQFEERSKNYRPVSLLSVVSKVFEKLVNNGIVDHLGKCGLFADSQQGFRSS